ncbi:PREDICTED: basic salivary proline-rich protein 1-like [Condylura cristata]|uniref:basic salivary proline-rich protein 1-like n=1 Tax=Condylura cristata TaxID=143302 RepID=UPI000642CC29|nr:PREDICTED: basic salivary proline-rich protein 1-like [Condylura cristata]
MTGTRDRRRGGAQVGSQVPGGAQVGSQVPGGAQVGSQVPGEAQVGSQVPGGAQVGSQVPGGAQGRNRQRASATKKKEKLSRRHSWEPTEPTPGRAPGPPAGTHVAHGAELPPGPAPAQTTAADFPVTQMGEVVSPTPPGSSAPLWPSQRPEVSGQGPRSRPPPEEPAQAPDGQHQRLPGRPPAESPRPPEHAVTSPAGPALSRQRPAQQRLPCVPRVGVGLGVPRLSQGGCAVPPPRPPRSQDQDPDPVALGGAWLGGSRGRHSPWHDGRRGQRALRPGRSQGPASGPPA